MFKKKAQADIMDMALTFVIVGAFTIVSLLIFATFANTSDSLFDPDTLIETNESVTVSTTSAAGDNSTLLAKSGYVADSETVRNATAPFVQLNRGVDYKIIRNENGLNTRGNFTLINATADGFNNTALFVSYSFQQKSETQTSVDVIETTVLDSFSLGVISLIVLAAVVILAVLFRLGT